jgi:hypothetical protein
VALRMPPDALMRCDDEVLDELVELAGRARTEELWALEVAGLTAELVHAQWRLTVQVHSKKGARPPRPLRLPRPWAAKEPLPPQGRRISVGELARLTGREG